MSCRSVSAEQPRPPEVDPRRALPQVDALALQFLGAAPDELVRLAVRRVLESARSVAASDGVPDRDMLIAMISDELAAAAPVRAVINGTGVLLHTNLGRAPLCPPDPAAPMAAVDIELDLATGKRGRRLVSLERAICALTGAEDALVVNNNAAAILLALAALVGDGEVIVSRGQLVEIGGGFRIPDVISQGGAHLVEVGTTNRTRLGDYAGAITDRTALLLEVHPSNYTITGFTESVDTATLAGLAAGHGVPLVVDIGSGLLDARVPWMESPPEWLRREPAARQCLDAGADLVTFSGDKLLGGPQAGIACGARPLIDQMRRHPLARAVRYDKTRTVMLDATLRAYLDRTVTRDIPFWRMATIPVDALHARAETLVTALSGHAVRVEPCEDRAGGGSTPAEVIPGVAIVIATTDPDGFCAALLQAARPVSAVVHDRAVWIHLRSVDPADDTNLTAAIRSAERPPR